jgi:tetratricopeptide (TPR) repeat protein
MNKLFFLFLVLSCLFASCYKVSNKLEPKIEYTIDEKHFQALSAPFAPLNEKELHTGWGREYKIALSFAKELDLYRATSTFKRAQILLPATAKERKLEIEYYILLCYYLGKKYPEVIESFEKSALLNADATFPPFHDLLVILYDSYKKMGETEKASHILERINHSFEGTGAKLILSDALVDADIASATKLSKDPHFNYLPPVLQAYENEKKSIRKAQFLNAIIPGSGYFYVGQKRTAVTACLVNGLFIAAAYQFFHRGLIAAGIITSSLEMGWYCGGIYGGGDSAKFYNEQLYQQKINGVINKHGLFPIYMLQFSF